MQQAPFSTLPSHIASIQGAANAAVGAMSQMHEPTPWLTDDRLTQASARLAGSLSQLEEKIGRLLSDVPNAPQHDPDYNEANQKLVSEHQALLREHASLQEMLVALKNKYESVDQECKMLSRRVEEMEAQHSATRARTDTVCQGLNQAIATIDHLLRESA